MLAKAEISARALHRETSALAHIRIGKMKLRVPQSKAGRKTLGSALLVGGAFAWLPVLGLWMVPAGLAVLSVDSPKVRRFRRSSEVRAVRWWRARKAAAQARSKTPNEKGPGD